MSSMTWKDDDQVTPELLNMLMKRIAPLEVTDSPGADEHSKDQQEKIDRMARKATFEYCRDIILGTRKNMHDAEIMVNYFYYGFIACIHHIQKEKQSVI